ncbi:hypothetical protein BGX29_007286 [Mortierella sp. GBA35]|nr:hypothetical protein BGX29_007286 [Mortierella sp. GBA35]
MAQQKVSFKKWWKNITGTKAVKVGLFHIDLVDSIQYAGVPVNVTINGKTRCQGYIPTIVNKCGYYLKEQATQTRGIFRVSGSAKRVSELQIIFDTPPNYGSQLEWTGFTVHDASNVLRRYLNHLPDPVITLEYYEKFRDVHRNLTDDEEKISAYQELISKLPPPHACLLMYLLDLLSIFAHHSEENLMDSKNLASVFQPGVISHPNHAMSPGEYMTSAAVLKFLIDNQSSFTMPKPNIDEDDEEMVNFGLASPSQGRLPAQHHPALGSTFHGGYVSAADHERLYDAMSGPGVSFDPEDVTIKRRLSLQRPIIPRSSLPGNTPQRSHSTTSSTSSHHSHSNNVFSSTFMARRRSSRRSKTASKLLSESDLQAVASEAAQDLSDIPENPKSAEEKVEPLQRTSSIRKASTSPVISSEEVGEEFSNYLNLRKQLKSEGLLREPSLFCQTVEIQFPAPLETDRPESFKPSPPTILPTPLASTSSLPPAPMSSPPSHPSERSKQSFGETLPTPGRKIPIPSTTAHVHIPDRPLRQQEDNYIAPPPLSHHQEGPRMGLGLRRISGAGQSAQNLMSDRSVGITRQRHISPGMAITRAKSNPGDLVSTGARSGAHSGGHGGGHQAIEKFKGLFSGKSRDHDLGSGKDDPKVEKRRESLTDKQRKYKSQEVTSSQIQGTTGSGWRGPLTNQTIGEHDGGKPERPYVQPPPPIPRESPQRPAPPPPEGSLMDFLDPPQRIGVTSGYASSSNGSRSDSPSLGASSRRALPTNSSFTSTSSPSPTPSGDRLYQGRGLASQGSSASLELAVPGQHVGDGPRPPQRSPRQRYSPDFDTLQQGQFSSEHLPQLQQQQQQQQQHLSPYGPLRPHQHFGHSSDLGYDHEEGHPLAPPTQPYDSSPRSMQGSFGSTHTYDSNNNNAPPTPTPKSRERRSPREGSTSSFRGDAAPPRARSNSSRNPSPHNSPALKPLARNASHQSTTSSSGGGGTYQHQIHQHAPSPLAEGLGHGHGHGHGSGGAGSYVTPPPSSRARNRAQSRDELHYLQRTDTGGSTHSAQRSYERERSRSAAALLTAGHHQQQQLLSNSPSLPPLASSTFPNPTSPPSRPPR